MLHFVHVLSMAPYKTASYFACWQQTTVMVSLLYPSEFQPLTTMATIGKATKLSVATLAIMNVTAVVSLRGLPAEAEYGLSSAFYYLFAAIVFLIPTALVAAELAAMFSDKQAVCSAG